MNESFNFPSLLDKDDINGLGQGSFPRSTKSYSVDFAVYKISIFSSLESANDKIKFIKDIDLVILQLGKQEIKPLFTVFNLIVSHN
jgi:hypothetical protein